MSRLTHRPSLGPLLLGFGPRPLPTPTSPAIHWGQDYGWRNGDDVFAAAAGTVLEYREVGAYGNRLVIDHGNGYRTWYCHLSAPLVRVNTQVVGGQRVAVMGATGNVTGKHLHFELRINGVAVDPAPYFTTTAGMGTSPLEDDLDATQAYQLDQVFKALLGVDAAGNPVKLDPSVNLGQSIRQSIWEARKGVQRLIDSPVGVESLADAIVARLPAGVLTKQDVKDAVAELGIPAAAGAEARAAIVK